MSLPFKVWGEYSMPVIKEVWEGEIPSENLRELCREDYTMEHSCVIDAGNTYEGDDTYCYIFIHKDYPDATANCHSVTCSWSFTQSSVAGTRASLVLRVPPGVPDLYATLRDNTLRALFKNFNDDDYDYSDGI